MLISGKELIDMPVMGLQTGKELAQTSVAVINPRNLSVIAYRVSGAHLDHDPSYLRTADIREIGSLGMIVDSSDEFLEPDDIISDKKIYDLEFELDGKQVVDDHKTKIGKVNDYIIDLESFVIQQIVVKRPLLKSFKDDELLVHRSQIVEVTDDTIVIKSGKLNERVKSEKSHSYVNPFSQSSPQPEAARTDTGS